MFSTGSFSWIALLCLVPVASQTWTSVGTGVEQATLSSVSGFTVTARRFDVSSSGGKPANPTNDGLGGPSGWSFRYGTTKKFFPVSSPSGEGVVWQDPTSLKIYLTWLGGSLNSVNSIALPSTGTDNLIAAAGNPKTGEIVYVVFQKTANPDKVTPAKVQATRVNSAGQSQKSVDLNSGGALGAWQFFTSGGSMVWDTTTGQLGFLISRQMVKSSDGLNHQGCIAVTLDASTLAIVKNHGQTSGHSWGNSVSVGSDGKFLALDIGDNYPRGVHLHRFSAASGKQSKVVYTFKTVHGKTATSPAGKTYPEYTEISTAAQKYYKWSNDNEVYTEIGHPGLIEVSGGILAVFSGETQGGALNNAMVGKSLNSARNLQLVKVTSDFNTVLSSGPTESGGFYNFGGGWSAQQNKGVVKLTSYTDLNTQNAVRVKTARLGSGSNLIAYELWTPSAYVDTAMMVVNDDGTIVKPATSVGTNVRLPPTDDPFVKSGKMIYFHGDTSGKIIRYEVAASGSGSTSTNRPTTGSTPTNRPTAPTNRPTSRPTAPTTSGSWSKVEKSHCSGFKGPTTYQTLAAAQSACLALKSSCSGVYDPSCDNKPVFYTCTNKYNTFSTSATSCVYKSPLFAASAGAEDAEEGPEDDDMIDTPGPPGSGDEEVQMDAAPGSSLSLTVLAALALGLALA